MLIAILFYFNLIFRTQMPFIINYLISRNYLISAILLVIGN